MEATVSRVDSGISFQNAQGREVKGTLLHISPEAIVFEVYSPYPVAEPGQELKKLRVLRSGVPVYDGKATVHSILATGMTIIVSARPSGTWSKFDEISGGGTITAEARSRIADWGNSRPLLPEYQVAVSNIRAFLTEMSQWLAPLDVATSAAGPGALPELPAGIALALYGAIAPRLELLFTQYEEAFNRVPAEEAAAHRIHAQRELHPLVLCAPLIHRSYVKPMGYAGDYGTVKMILENRIEGPSTYARVLNAFFTRIDICQGHRNRIDRLVDILRKEVRRPRPENAPLRVLNLGCGPVDEVCRFILQDELAGQCEFTLLDFSQETIDYAKTRVDEACGQAGRHPRVEWVTQSIHDLLKEAIRSGRSAEEPKYHLAYCAGLFDYLSDRVCLRLLGLLNDWVVPDGLVVATNVHPRYQTHAILEDLADWHLILRNESEMLALAPPGGHTTTVSTEPCGVNVFLELRKPEDVNDFGRNTRHSRIPRERIPGI